MTKCILLASILTLTHLNINGQEDCQPKPQGWTIRVCVNETEARGFRLWIGVGGNRHTHRFWRDWVKGQPAEFSLPIDLFNAKEIWIKAENLQRKKNVYICVRYNGHTTQHLDFDGRSEEHETSRGDNDECDCN